MLRHFIWNVWMHKKGITRIWRDIDHFNALSPSEAREHLAKRLAAQIRYFGNRDDALPEWRELANGASTDEIWQAWSSLPIVTKRDLRTRFHPREIKNKFKIDGIISSTGGSTGEPTPYLHDVEMLLATTATRTYAYKSFGWQPGTTLITIWGSERDIGHQLKLRNRFSAFIRGNQLVDGYSLDDKTVDRVFDIIHRNNRVAIYGFSSMLDFVAREAIARNDRSAIGKVVSAWCGGEMLLDSYVESFKKAFGVPILNMYGCREFSAIAYQSAVGLPLQVIRPFIFVEIVDDAGKPLPAGVPGRLIVTSTVCRGTPFMRYDIGDIATVEETGRGASGIIALSRLYGRSAGLLSLPNGGTINCLFWNHLFKEFQEVHQFQVAVSDSRLELRLIGDGFSPSREAQIKDIIAKLVGHDSIVFRWVDNLPRTAQGKLVQVVRETVQQKDLVTK